MLPAIPSALVAASGVELAEARGRGRGAEDAADRGRVEARACGRRRAPPSRSRIVDLVACDDRQPAARGRSRRAASAASDGSRHDHGRHVRDRLGVRVVEVEPVAEHRVRERGVRAGSPVSSPITVASGSPPSSAIVARPSAATPRPCAASPQPSASSTCSFAASTTGGGTASRSSSSAHAANRSAAFIPSTPRSCPGSCVTASGRRRL